MPHVADDQRLEIKHLDHEFHTVTVHYGFMDSPTSRARWPSFA